MHVVEGLGGNWVWALLAKAQTRYVSSVALAGMADLTLQDCTASAGWTGWTVGGWWERVWYACGKWALFCFFLFLSFPLSFPQPHVGYILPGFPDASSGRTRCNRITAIALLHCICPWQSLLGCAKKECSRSTSSDSLQRFHFLSFLVNKRKRERECTVLDLLHCTRNAQVLYIKYLMQQLPVCKPCAKTRTQPEVHIDERRRLGKWYDVPRPAVPRIFKPCTRDFSALLPASKITEQIKRSRRRSLVTLCKTS